MHMNILGETAEGEAVRIISRLHAEYWAWHWTRPHELTQNQESDIQLTEPPRCPTTVFFVYLSHRSIDCYLGFFWWWWGLVFIFMVYFFSSVHILQDNFYVLWKSLSKCPFGFFKGCWKSGLEDKTFESHWPGCFLRRHPGYRKEMPENRVENKNRYLNY